MATRRFFVLGGLESRKNGEPTAKSLHVVESKRDRPNMQKSDVFCLFSMNYAMIRGLRGGFVWLRFKLSHLFSYIYGFVGLNNLLCYFALTLFLFKRALIC